MANPSQDKEMEYHDHFISQLRISMLGLLEPKGKLLEEYGQETVVKSVTRLTFSLIELIEYCIKHRSKVFDGSYPRNNMQEVFRKSKVMLKNHYWQSKDDYFMSAYDKTKAKEER